MLVIRWILIMVVLLLVILFSYQNMDQSVVVKFWQYQTRSLPLIVVMFASFASGLCVWFLVSLIQNLRLKKNVRVLQNKTNKLEQELANLRNISIDENIKPEETKEN